MGYFIFKNIDSRDVKGLITSTLPPITKPKMRTQVLTLDGRDGSIITPLGYEAYKKTVKIGLTSGYDIDNLISWLNGAGQAIFSSEPDKYYNAQILDAVDYERLLRFKTANIVFDVQPFKYSTTERTRTFDVSGSQFVKIANAGNYTAKPLIKIKGSGTINFYVNDVQAFTLELLTNDNITLDSAEQEAYDDNGLRNRAMNGNFPVLAVGTNTLSWTGTITEIQISQYSRWL